MLQGFLTFIGQKRVQYIPASIYSSEGSGEPPGGTLRSTFMSPIQCIRRPTHLSSIPCFDRYPVHISPNMATCYEADGSLRRKKALTETAVPRTTVFF